VKDIAPGTTVTVIRVVEDIHCTSRGDHRILSTPSLILFLEEAAASALAGHLDERQATVGTRVAIVHEASTLLGQSVTITATVTAVDRRRVAFSVAASDRLERLASGQHERFVVDLDVLDTRLSTKAVALGQLKDAVSQP